MCVTINGEFISETSKEPTHATVYKETQKEHTYTVDGLINGGAYHPGGLISGIIYIRVGKWMGLYPGGALKWDFTVLLTDMAVTEYRTQSPSGLSVCR